MILRVDENFAVTQSSKVFLSYTIRAIVPILLNLVPSLGHSMSTNGIPSKFGYRGHSRSLLASEQS